MFPSPYGVSFILIEESTYDNDYDSNVFPSPYGVSFILINKKHLDECLDAIYTFPSPYGVSFILILSKNEWLIFGGYCVSVSLRSIIHSYILYTTDYPKNCTFGFPSPYGVSFILISIL